MQKECQNNAGLAVGGKNEEKAEGLKSLWDFCRRAARSAHEEKRTGLNFLKFRVFLREIYVTSGG